jgi:hypothetical protein
MLLNKPIGFFPQLLCAAVILFMPQRKIALSEIKNAADSQSKQK